MSLTHPNTPVSQQDLHDFYHMILPYFGGGNIQLATMPTASAIYEDMIVQYIGATDSTYTNGYFYQCQESSGTYSWVAKNVQAGGGGGSTLLSQTLTAGSTSVTFTGIPTSGNNIINFYTSTGINYTAINTATAGQVTLTYESQSSDVVVQCEIKGVS